MSIKYPNDTIGNRNRDLLACSVLPQPTAPPRTPLIFFFLVWGMKQGQTWHPRSTFVRSLHEDECKIVWHNQKLSDVCVTISAGLGKLAIIWQLFSLNKNNHLSAVVVLTPLHWLNHLLTFLGISNGNTRHAHTWTRALYFIQKNSHTQRATVGCLEYFKWTQFCSQIKTTPYRFRIPFPQFQNP